MPETDTDSSDDSYESSDHGYALETNNKRRSQYEYTSSSEYQSSDPDVEAEMQILFDGVEAAASTMKTALENDGQPDVQPTTDLQMQRVLSRPRDQSLNIPVHLETQATNLDLPGDSRGWVAPMMFEGQLLMFRIDTGRMCPS